MLVDSNILIFAINTASPHHHAAQSFLRQQVNSLGVAHQNILEAIRVLTHKKFTNPMTSHAALYSIEGITNGLSLVAPDQETIFLAQALIKKHHLTSDKIFDAYLAATAITNDITTIATDNVKDFRDFEGVSAFSPFAN